MDNEPIEVKLARIETEVKNIKEELKELVKCIKTEYVQMTRFSPIEKLYYTLVGTSLLAVLYAIITGAIPAVRK